MARISPIMLFLSKSLTDLSCDVPSVPRGRTGIQTVFGKHFDKRLTQRQ